MVEHRVLGPEDGELYEFEQACGDRFLINGRDWGGRFSLVEHRIPPKVLAAPYHQHTQEDEFSFILEGTVGARFGDALVEAHHGDLVFKPRGEWHTFWNAGDTPARLLEIISPAGREEVFRWMDRLTEELDPDELDRKLGPHGCIADMATTMEIAREHQLVF